jgi:hypothetical protein
MSLLDSQDDKVVLLVFCSQIYSFAVRGSMAIVKAVEALHNLILRGKLLCCIVHVVHVVAVRNTSIGGMRVVHIDYNRVVEFDFVAGVASFAS